MQTIPVPNPFGGPVYLEGRVSSTMDVSRRLAAEGAPQGTVIAADFQERGRGRTAGRPWLGDGGDNLFFTLLLHYGSIAAIPAALSLRTGLALSLAVEDLLPPLAGLVRIKWPNDMMILLPRGGRKTAGILSESDGSVVFIGIGVNVRQREFPPELRSKATSLSLALGELSPGDSSPGDTSPGDTSPGDLALEGDLRFSLLALILSRLSRELGTPGGGPSPGAAHTAGDAPDGDWRRRLEERLYMKGKSVRFIAGGADSGQPVEGRLRGIGPGGELLILLPGGGERAFITGELELYG
jgi:BirA family biotin operon repressor/biotin-[acetyl-CoA-carboxylase] ligase